MKTLKVKGINILVKYHYQGYEKVVFFSCSESKVEGIIAIHNTTFGPALGGCRIYTYSNFNEGLNDALMLAKNMSYKNTIFDLPYGGGKTVIFNKENLNKQDILQVLSQVLNYLNGIYLTTDDVGTSVGDIKYLRQFTPYARGEFVEDNMQIPATSYGVYKAIKAILHGYSIDDPPKIKISIQGLGKVGYNLCKFLYDDGYKLYVSDIKEDLVRQAEKEFQAIAVNTETQLEEMTDIFVPCAMGGVITPHNIFGIKAKYIVGAANNSLTYEYLDNILWEKNIKYFPDYLCNAGGVIDIACEGEFYSEDYVYNSIDAIYKKVLDLVNTSVKSNVSPMSILNHYIQNNFQTIK